LRHNPQDIEGRAKICAEMLPTINKFKNAVLKSGYLKKLSEELSVPEDALLQELKKVKEDRGYFGLQQPAHKRPLNINATEKLLIKLMLEEAELINRIKDVLEPGDFQDRRTSRIISTMFELVSEGKNMEPSKLINYLRDEEVSQILCESEFLEVPEENREKIVNDCVRRLKADRLRLRKYQLHEEIKQAQHAGNENKVKELVAEFHNLIRKR